MEFKVWVGGIQRVVCGVTSETTCQDIILALAHATGQTGRFTLLEKWRENEEFLVPSDRPLHILQKWGEYATDVQFVLRKSRTNDKWPNQDLRLPPQVKRSHTFSGAQLSNRESSSSDVPDDTAEKPLASVSPFMNKSQEPTVDVPTPESSPERIIRSPGSGSSLPSPQNTMDRTKLDYFSTDTFKFNREEFTKKILEKGTVEDLTKFIALQKERLKLLEEESEFLANEESKYSDPSVVETLRRKEKDLAELLSQLSDDDDSHGTSRNRQSVEKLYSEIVTLRAKLNDLDQEIEGHQLKIRILTDQIDKALRDGETLEKERKITNIRLLEAEHVQKELDEVKTRHTGTDVSLTKIVNDLRVREDDLRLRTGVMDDLEKQLNSLNMESFTRSDSREENTEPKSPHSTRRLVITPQSLADTAPTISNPYGMWV